MTGVELHYAREALPFYRRRWVQLLLLIVIAVVISFNALIRPIVQRGTDALHAYRLKRDLAASMQFQFPLDTVAYSEGSPSQTDIATPWPRLQESLAPLIRQGLASGERVVFLGQRKNVGGEPRLVIVTASGNSPNVTLQMQLIDPGDASTPPRSVSEKQWNLGRSKLDRKLTIFAGRPTSSGASHFAIPMRYDDRDAELSVSVIADDFELSGGPGWRDDRLRRWTLDDEQVGLVELPYRPRKVEFFEKGLSVTPAVTINSDGELVGVSLRGIQTIRLGAADSHEAVTTKADWLRDTRNGQVWNFKLSRDGSRAYVGGYFLGFPGVASTQTGVVGPKCELPVGRRHDAAFSPDGRRVYVTAEGVGAAAFDVETGRELWRKPVTGETICAGGDRVAVVNGWMGSRSYVRILSADDGRLVGMVPIKSWFERASLSPDGTLLAITSDTNWKIVKVADGSSLFWAPGEMTQVEPVWSPGGQLLAAAGAEFVYVWNLKPPMVVYRIPISRLSPLGRRLMFSADSTQIVLATSGQNAVLIWELKDIVGQ